ncbi:calcium channel flower isoform X2 [Nasonia vitripennis]|uniref:Calcium channel flower n=1 Tax=Nasonia vitripennis TaxID=7425 RepID=A0A7M7PY74_NASVI|nr:calcium channel flower isoform X2 [Nasonia vitripennis]
MSFSEKFASIMARPGQDPQAKDDVPWWMKYGGRILGIVGGFLAIFLGVWNCVSILLANVSCFLSGLTQMIAGFIVLTIEAPCCCMFIDFVQNFSEWVDKRPYWNRAAAYCLMAIPPFLLCIGATSFFGSGLIFATGVVYGMMSIGKKGSGADPTGLPTSAVGSPQGQMPPGDHHTTLMEDPDVWRPT